jgi:hypothetical protein
MRVLIDATKMYKAGMPKSQAGGIWRDAVSMARDTHQGEAASVYQFIHTLLLHPQLSLSGAASSSLAVAFKAHSEY